jgi:aspartoacylase
MDHFNQVLVVAGTHGNELSGIYIEKLIRNKQLNVQRPSFKVEALLANPKATASNVRFVDTDLNRLFAYAVQQPLALSNESEIAVKLQQEYSSKQNLLIIDLHNTTSHMGATLILLDRTPYYEKMGAYVKKYMPQANILFESKKTWEEHPYLCTMTGAGVMIEVEEQSHGVLTHQSLKLMKKLLLHVLDFINDENQQISHQLPDYEAYELSEAVHFPINEQCMRLATVHPDICGKDFIKVKPGEALLTTFSDVDYCWQGKNSTYPHFINEAAYANQNIAMALADKIYIRSNV